MSFNSSSDEIHGLMVLGMTIKNSRRVAVQIDLPIHIAAGYSLIFF